LPIATQFLAPLPLASAKMRAVAAKSYAASVCLGFI
jgi:hypothetical protein